MSDQLQHWHHALADTGVAVIALHWDDHLDRLNWLTIRIDARNATRRDVHQLHAAVRL